jgi:hypothetical protein
LGKITFDVPERLFSYTSLIPRADSDDLDVEVDSIVEPNEDDKRRRFRGKGATPGRRDALSAEGSNGPAGWLRSVSALAALEWG